MSIARPFTAWRASSLSSRAPSSKTFFFAVKGLVKISSSSNIPCHTTTQALFHTPNPILKHPIRRDRIFLPQLAWLIQPRRRNAILQLFLSTIAIRELLRIPIQHRPREGQVLRHQSQLDQHRRLVPCDVLVVQAVAADIDDGREGDLELAVGWWDPRDTAARGRSVDWR